MSARNSSDAVNSILSKIDQLHTAPRVAQRVLAITQSPDFDVRQVAVCLELDPALAARILRVVNSSRFGLAHSVTSLTQAITYFGQRSLRLLVMTFGLVEGLTKGVRAEFYRSFHRRALTMAVVDSHLLDPTVPLTGNPRRLREEGYAAGLLADLGVLLFVQALGDEYIEVTQSLPHDGSLVQQERAKFGCTHAELGAALLENWNVSDDLVDAVLLHHERDLPPDDEFPLAIALRTSSLFSEVLWNPKSPHLAPLRQELDRHFGLDTDGFISLALSCKEELKEQEAIFATSVSSEEIDCELLKERARRLYTEAALDTALDLDSLTAIFDDHSSD